MYTPAEQELDPEHLKDEASRTTTERDVLADDAMFDDDYDDLESL
jgi:hypothetical protein